MAYTLNNTLGTTLVTLKDGTIDTSTTDLSLFGKGYPGFGERMNENFISLLENFTSTSSPSNKIRGQLWYDATNNQMNVYTGSKWKPVGSTSNSATAPTNAVQGDQWWDTVNGQLYVYNGSTWVLVGPTSVAGSGVTAMIPESILSTLGQTKSILKGVAGDSVVFVVSGEAFTPESTAGTLGADLIAAGFANVQKGITLSTSISDNKFYGTARAADNLVISGTLVPAANFLRADESDTMTGTLTATAVNTNANTPPSGTHTITGSLTVTGTLSATETVSTSVSSLIVEDNLVVLNSTTSGLLPSGQVNYAGLQVNRGASSGGAGPSSTLVQDAFWVFDETFGDDGTTTFGNAGGAWTAYRSANNLNDKNLIDIRANVFHGQATSASYADLAEKYTSDQDYPVGTIMCVGGDQEVTASTAGCVPVGVISEHPAYLMNSESEGVIVGLKGKVPVRVNGQVNKGDVIYVTDSAGVGSKIADDGAYMVGIALESHGSNGEKLVNCILKV